MLSCAYWDSLTHSSGIHCTETFHRFIINLVGCIVLCLHWIHIIWQFDNPFFWKHLIQNSFWISRIRFTTEKCSSQCNCSSTWIPTEFTLLRKQSIACMKILIFNSLITFILMRVRMLLLPTNDGRKINYKESEWMNEWMCEKKYKAKISCPTEDRLNLLLFKKQTYNRKTSKYFAYNSWEHYRTLQKLFSEDDRVVTEVLNIFNCLKWFWFCFHGMWRHVNGAFTECDKANIQYSQLDSGISIWLFSLIHKTIHQKQSATIPI